MLHVLSMKVVGFRTRLIDVSSIGERRKVDGTTEVEISDGFTRVIFDDWRLGPVAKGDEYIVTIMKALK